ncbi:uncharacterized protein LOC130589824 [Beta vulgaris subsp. vulgaris]|uniref:uncharacterized protein LOC130589824 n=1 Tax=Beta vulgaris subsp. vulgaris TaxID=3555 RepID=UPI000900B335|nr:uncharacterized protein LOC130589824 [Beta vulgaris subsp. vulgaris]
MEDIRNRMGYCALSDIKSYGNFYTWNNKQFGRQRVISKLDRVMANSSWQTIFSSAEVCFQNKGEYDHSPALINVYPKEDSGEKPFRYYRMWKVAPQFTSMVSLAWNQDIHGTKIYVIMTKFKLVKVALKELNKQGFSEIHSA